ncbi:MAG TPA: NlpC/P60 family protein [Candidatus Paceibacterota bacterium]|nr:NlpC/P60 family protein [Candidatus Paceibacterota bacterium]
MNYQSVGNRLAVDFGEFNLPISTDQALNLLNQKGFGRIDVDIVSLGRSVIGIAKYSRGARLSEAPNIFDCSSLMKWLYGQKGIWLPRRSIQQREYGIPIDLSEIHGGDLVFTSGFIDYYLNDPSDGVGHVGVATGDDTIIHAVNKKFGIVETPLKRFIRDGLRGVRRFIPKDRKIYTFITPPNREVEWSDDVRWIILQSLGNRSSRPAT